MKVEGVRTVANYAVKGNNLSRIDPMPPIDYSKWDNIDTDSEPETSPQQAPAAKPTPPATHASPPMGTSGLRETHSKSGHVEAVIVRCEAEKRKFPLWSATIIPANHNMFSQSVPSVPALIEAPLVLYCMQLVR